MLIAAGTLFLLTIWAVVFAKVFLVVFSSLPKKYRPAWLWKLRRLAPSWQLFAQRGAPFDLYALWEVRCSCSFAGAGSLSMPNRKWYYPILNPGSKFRFLVRQHLQIVLYYGLQNRVNEPEYMNSVQVIHRHAAQVATRHDESCEDGDLRVHVVFDRGFHSVSGPEIKLTLGPWRW